MVDYTATLEDDTVVATTRKEDVLKTDAELKTEYGPQLISVDDAAYPVPRGFDAALAAAELDTPEVVRVEAADAYGAWDRRKVKMLTLRKLGDDAERAVPGETISVDGRKGVVRFVGSGRVKMDFNHPHAGKVIIYNYTVTKELKTAEERIEAMLQNVGMEQDGYELTDGQLNVNIPPSLFRADGIQNKKFVLQMDLFAFITGLTEVRFVETFTKKHD